ncbi:MAG: hypothetical protein mread185_000214 [Mycoplasmataceae bacterium]|nr:MAG: hypothetical protein mread185_000214 [Mycoplasmataceae bacterium]
MKKQHQQLLITALALGFGYYFLIHLPEEENKKKASKAKVQTTPQKSPEALKAEAEADAWQKGRIWELPVNNWADKIVNSKKSSLLGEYQKYASLFPDGDNHHDFYFSRSAPYKIFFPPSMREYYEKGKELELENCEMLENEKDLILADEINTWISRATLDPTRGNYENGLGNNALFYGAAGTGKTATMKNLCVKADRYPLVVIQGSNLTPTESDQSAEILPLHKFAYTISELEWSLVKDYGLEREENGEVRYILFVDEANQISNNSLIFQSTELKFLKDCLENVDQETRSNNLWVFATNYIEQVEEPVYREGRLSNPLDFSWNWETFLKHAERENIYDELPERWTKKAYLKPEDNELVAKFNIKVFTKEFLGNDPQRPNKSKFWSLFIEKNPDAKYTPENKQKENEKKKEWGEEDEDEVEIEIGEFLEFFWYMKKKNMSNYDGTFEKISKVTVETILDTRLSELIKITDKKLNKIIEELEKGREEGHEQIMGGIEDVVKILANK